jgi:hypothetical protein
MKMFDIPWIGQWDAIFGGEPKAAWSAHFSHLNGTLPTRGDLVHSFTVEHMSEYEVTYMECPLMDETLVVVPRSLV